MLDFPASPTNGQVFYSNAVQPPVMWVYSSAKGQWVRNKGTALSFNKVINPTMQISQQNGSTFGSTTNYYVADQWRFAYVASANNYLASRSSGPTLRGSQYVIYFDVNKAP